MGSEGQTLVIIQILTNSREVEEHLSVGLQVEIGHNILLNLQMENVYKSHSLVLCGLDGPTHAESEREHRE